MPSVRIYRVKWDHAAMGTPNEYVVFYLDTAGREVECAYADNKIDAARFRFEMQSAEDARWVSGRAVRS